MLSFEEVPVTVRLPTAVSASFTVNSISPELRLTTVDRSASALIVGAVFGGITVSTKLLLAVNCPSLTVTVMVAVPVWSLTGDILNQRFAPEPPNDIFAVEARAGLDEVADRVNPATGWVASAIVKSIAAVWALRVVERFSIAEIVGAVFFGCTVTSKLVDFVRDPSLTVRVTVVSPTFPATGVSVRKRMPPPPPREIPPLVNTEAFDEVAVSERPDAGVWASLTINSMGSETVSASRICEATEVMDGGVFGCVTVSTKVVEVVA